MAGHFAQFVGVCLASVVAGFDEVAKHALNLVQLNVSKTACKTVPHHAANGYYLVDVVSDQARMLADYNKLQAFYLHRIEHMPSDPFPAWFECECTENGVAAAFVPAVAPTNYDTQVDVHHRNQKIRAIMDLQERTLCSINAVRAKLASEDFLSVQDYCVEFKLAFDFTDMTSDILTDDIIGYDKDKNGRDQIPPQGGTSFVLGDAVCYSLNVFERVSEVVEDDGTQSNPPVEVLYNLQGFPDYTKNNLQTKLEDLNGKDADDLTTKVTLFDYVTARQGVHDAYRESNPVTNHVKDEHSDLQFVLQHAKEVVSLCNDFYHDVVAPMFHCVRPDSFGSRDPGAYPEEADKQADQSDIDFQLIESMWETCKQTLRRVAAFSSDQECVYFNVGGFSVIEPDAQNDAGLTWTAAGLHIDSIERRNGLGQKIRNVCNSRDLDDPPNISATEGYCDKAIPLWDDVKENAASAEPFNAFHTAAPTAASSS